MLPAISIKTPEWLASGLWADPLPDQPALWRDGENVEFRDGEARKASGWAVQNTLSAPVTGLAQAYVDGQKRVYVGTDTELRMFLNGANSEIGRAADYNGGQWSMISWGTFLIATNDVDPPQIWKNTGQAEDWAPDTIPFDRAAVVRRVSTFPMLFHGQRAAWPAYNNFEDFEPGPGKRAGEYFIRDIDSDVIAVEPLGESLVYYTANMAGFTTFVGGEGAFSFKTQQGAGVGAVSKNAVVVVGPLHYGMSRMGPWRFDGAVGQYIAKPQIGKWIEDQLDWTRADEVVAHHNQTNATVEFYFPCKDGVIRGVGHNYKNGSWTKLKKPVAVALPQQVFGSPIAGIGNTWAFLGQGNNAGASALEATLRTAPLDAGASTRYKMWGSLEVGHTSNGLFQFRVGYLDRPDETPDWQEWETLVAGPNWLIERESVYIVVEFRSTALGADWRIGAIEIYATPTSKVK